MASSINILQRLRSLVPLPSVYVGVVLEIHEEDHTSTVQIPGPGVTDYAGNVAVGSILRPRGTSVPVGHRAFVRAGVIETEAPDGDILDIEVGKIIVTPAPPPVGGAVSVGFLTDRFDEFSAPDHAQSGAGDYPLFPTALTAGVVGYTTGVVVWSSTWSELAGLIPQPDLEVYGDSGERVRVIFNHGDGITAPLFMLPEGLLIVSCTVGGVQSDYIQVAIGAPPTVDGYNPIAWGPVP